MSPTELSRATGISVPYASQILSGARPWPLPLALKAYDSFGEKLGPLTKLSKREIETARKMAKAA